MNEYSASSSRKLATCHPDLQRLFRSVLQDRDNTIIFGHRTPTLQFDLFKQGRVLQDGIWVISDKDAVITNCDGFDKPSMHNYMKDGQPYSLAVDSAPYTNGRMLTSEVGLAYYAGYVMHRAEQLGIPLRWGGDWDGDNDDTDQRLHDLFHYELINY